MIAAICFFACSFAAQAQDCKSALYQSYDSFLGEMDDLDSYRLNFTQTNVVQGKKSSISYIICKDDRKAYLFSDNYKVLREDQLTVSILGQENMIYISENDEDESKKLNQFRLLQEKFFDNAEEVSCAGLENGNTLVELKPINQSDEYQKVLVEFNEEDKKIFNYTIFLGDPEEEQLVFLEIHSFEKDQSFEELKKAPKDFIYASKNTVHEQYKNYALIDLTK